MLRCRVVERLTALNLIDAAPFNRQGQPFPGWPFFTCVIVSAHASRNRIAHARAPRYCPPGPNFMQLDKLFLSPGRTTQSRPGVAASMLVACPAPLPFWAARGDEAR